jgi:hypothetical protein
MSESHFKVAARRAVSSVAAPTLLAGLRGRAVRVVLGSLGLIGALLWVLARGGFPLLPRAGFWDTLRPGLFAVFWLSMALSTLARYMRWQFLLAPLAEVPFWRLIRVNAICMALITYLPFRLGEVARPALLREKGLLSAWAVAAAVAAERVIDGVVVSGVLLTGLALATPREPLPDHVGGLPVPVWIIPQTARLAALVFLAAFAVLAAFYWLRSQARRATEAAVGWVSKPLSRKLADIVERASVGLSFLEQVRCSAPYVTVTVAAALIQAFGFRELAVAIGLQGIGFVEALVVYGVLALGFSVPNAPGFFGTIQLALYAGLATYVAPEQVAREGAVFAFLYYVIHLTNVTLFAALALGLDVVSARAASLPTPPTR